MSNLGWVLAVLILLGVAGMVRRRRKEHSTARPGDRPSGSITRPRPTVTLPDLPSAAPAEPAPERGPAPPELADFTLLQSDELPDSILADLSELTASLGQPHPLMSRLSSGFDDPDALQEMVRRDPGLSAEVLRRVNSSAFGLSTPIVSVQYALTFLGSNFVRQVVLHAAVAPSIPLATTEQQAAVDRLWQASYIASRYAQLAAQQVGLPHASALATQVLLACLGDVIVVATRPELAPTYLTQYTLFERTAEQQTTLGANAGQLAAWLAQQWQLPEGLIEGLRHSLLPMSLPAEAHPLQGEARRTNLVAYTALIIGQRVMRDQSPDVGAVDLAKDSGLDCFYLPDHLEAAQLGPLLQLNQDINMRRKLNPLIATLLV